MSSNGNFVTRWNMWIPVKINVFIWRVMMDRIPTRKNLDKCNVEIESLLCPMCSGDVRDVSHLFFKFSLAHQLWSRIAWYCSSRFFIVSCL